MKLLENIRKIKKGKIMNLSVKADMSKFMIKLTGFSEY